MSLVISLGTNLGDKFENLIKAKDLLSEHWKLLEESQIYKSKAVDYIDQPDFLNQVLVFDAQGTLPENCLDIALGIEQKLGRVRNIPKGPRLIDIDILFWGTDSINNKDLQIPHPRLFQRSFIVQPLSELTYFKTLSESFEFPERFSNEAFPLPKV